MQSVNKQYATSENLESRMNIYKYGTNPQPFREWQSEKIGGGDGLRILELGCGTGDLWLHLYRKFKNCEIILSDLSDGMLNKSKENLHGFDIKFEAIDFHAIPYNDNSFDIVISNHNLYHSTNIDVALGEIRRVLKMGGKFYATTNSVEHLAEFRNLADIREGDPWPMTNVTDVFGAESGLPILNKYFPHVKSVFHINELHITDFDAVSGYFRSVRDDETWKLVLERESELKSKFEAEKNAHGYFCARTKACLFCCE